MNSQEPTRNSKRIHTLISILMIIVAALAGVLTWLSFAHDKLYSPFGVLATSDSGPNFYFGIAIYITIGASLLTAVLIRIALRISH